MTDSTAGPANRRADARRNRAAIVEAAVECLGRDPETSVGEIARCAGVGRPRKPVLGIEHAPPESVESRKEDRRRRPVGQGFDQLDLLQGKAGRLARQQHADKQEQNR